MHTWQIVINGPGYFDTAYDLPEGTTTLGRADENDIVLSGDLVSRKHARLHVGNDQLTLEDLGSRNGTRVNGQPLTGSIALKVGDSVSVGENSLAVRAAEPGRLEAERMRTSGVRRFGTGARLGSSVLLAKEVKESTLLQALDNVLPFDADASLQAIPAASTPIAYESLLLLYKVAEKLAIAPSLQTFLEQTMDLVMARVEATTAVVLLRHASGALYPAAVRHRGKLEEGEVPVSDAILQAALGKGQALAVANVRGDQRFNRRESVILYNAAQVLCVPIGPQEPFAGVLYLNRSSGDEGELGALLDLCTAVSHLLSSGVQKFELRERGPSREGIRDALERFHAPDVVERRMVELSRKGGEVSGLEERPVTVLFAEIAQLSALTPKPTPAQVRALLEAFHQQMSAWVFGHEGTVDAFLGDSVRAIFGTPYARGDDTLRAVRCALAMREEWERTAESVLSQPACPLGIGLHTGVALTGVIGSGARLDHACVGEPVSVASALCGVAAPGQILVSGKTLAAIGARFDVTPLGERILPAGRERLPVFEVLGEDMLQDPSFGEG